MTGVYGARSVKRTRATRSEMEHRHARLHELVAEGQPMTVRHAYYRAVVDGLVPKTEAGYRRVQRALSDMRERNELPFDWVADNTRWMRKPVSFDSIDQALADAAASYRRDLWSSSPVLVEVWCESDSTASTVATVTEEWDVPLMVTRGYPSKSFLWSSARTYTLRDRPVVIYYLGDLDPAGIEIESSIRDGLRRYAPDTEIRFERVAVTFDQRDRWDLPTTPAKNAKRLDFHGGAVELEALPAPALREMLAEKIVANFDMRKLELVLLAEAAERELFERMAHREVVG